MQEVEAGAVEALGDLQRAARQLLGLLALTSGAAAARRLADLLEAASPGLCAHIALIVITGKAA